MCVGPLFMCHCPRPLLVGQLASSARSLASTIVIHLRLKPPFLVRLGKAG
jgi:hypothetical protein